MLGPPGPVVKLFQPVRFGSCTARPLAGPTPLGVRLLAGCLRVPVQDGCVSEVSTQLSGETIILLDADDPGGSGRGT